MSVIQVYVRIENIGFKTQVRIEEKENLHRMDDGGGEKKRHLQHQHEIESRINPSIKISFRYQVAVTNSIHYIPYKLRK